MEVSEGWAEHGVPCGKRDLRPPADLKLDRPLRTLWMFLTMYCIGTVCLIQAIFAGFFDWLARICWRKPVSLRGRVCLVTGSGRGLGREICLELARRGAVLACADINEETNSETVRLVKEIGAKARSYRLNVADREAVHQAARMIEKELGPVYLVVNNAALIMPQKDPTEEFVRASFNVNVFGPYWVTQAFLPLLQARNEGHLIYICSIASLMSFPVLGVYSMTKAALRSFAQGISFDLQFKKSKVRVGCVHPSLMNTSEDYSCTFSSRMDIYVSMKQVVGDVMYLLKTGCFEVSTPHFLKTALFLPSLLSYRMTTDFIKKLGLTVLLPNVEEYDQLEPGRILRECGSIGKTV